MWLLSEYLATSLYSLKVSLATSSGGKTLLLPTPYALKMGLLDVAYRTVGSEGVGAWWPSIRDLRVAYRPPRYAVVSNVFTRILKPNRNPSAPGTRDAGPLGRTIGYREYVHYSEPFGLAVAPADGAEPPAWLSDLLAGLTYLGKRGGFVQLAGAPCVAAELPPGYVALNPAGGQAEFDRRGLLQMLDDCGPKMTLAQADIYSGEAVRVGRERMSYPVVIPYHLARASRGYTLYERLD